MEKTDNKSYSLAEMKDKYIGKVGTADRDEYEYELRMDVLGKMIKMARIERNLTQEQLGKLIGVQKSQISKLELTESVVFKPWANRETLVSYYKTADLFLNTSFFEGYGMTLVEAKAAGCRIVSTDVGMAREIGALIIDYDARDIAKTIISCL